MTEPTVDRSTVRLLIAILGVLAIVGLGGTLYLLNADKPGESVAVFAGLTGSLLGTLATLATNRSTPTGPVAAPSPAPAPDTPADPGSSLSGQSRGKPAADYDTPPATATVLSPGSPGFV